MWFRVCLFGLCAADCALAAYTPEDTIKLNADISYLYDSNLFRLDEAADNKQTIKENRKSDYKVEAKVGGRLDLVLSRQLLRAVADVKQINYANFTHLNHRDWSAELAWDWVLGNNASGQLSATTVSNMSEFEDNLLGVGANTQRDIQKQQGINWRGAYRLQSTIDITAAAGISSEDHDVKQYIDAKTHTAQIGMRYRSPLGNFVSVQQSWRKYSYDIDLPFRAGYTEQKSTINTAYSPSSRLNLFLSLGFSRWQSDLNGQSRTTPQGEMTLSWLATDKTQIKVSYSQLYAEFTSGVGRNLDQNLSFNTAWQMTEKINWNLNLSQRQRSLEIANSASLRDETRNSMRLGMGYKVMPQLTVNSYLQNEKQATNINNGDYHYYQVGVNAVYVY